MFALNDTLFLVDVFKNFRNMCLKLYKLDLAKFLSANWLTWPAAKVKLDLLTDIDMSLMVKKRIKGGICHSIYCYAKANNKCMKDYDKNKGSPYIHHWDVYNLNGWVMTQKLPVNNSEWIKDTFQFNEDFIKKL